MIARGLYQIVPNPQKDFSNDRDWWMVEILEGDYKGVFWKPGKLQVENGEDGEPDLRKVGFTYELLIVPEEVTGKDKDALDTLVCDMMIEILEGTLKYNENFGTEELEIEGELVDLDDE